MTNPVYAIAAYHLKKNLLSRGFILAVIGMPLLIVVSISIGFLTRSLQKTPAIGVVDPVNVVKITLPAGTAEENRIAIAKYPNREEGLKAVQAGMIDCLYVLPDTYPADRNVELIFQTQPTYIVQEYFQDVLRTNLLQNYPAGTVDRALYAPGVTIHSLDTNRVFSSTGPRAGDLLPLALGVIFMFSLFPISEILVGTLGDEKANRTMEIVLTSLKPSQLIFGKLIAASGIVVGVILSWLVMLLIGSWSAGAIWHVSWMQDFRLPWRETAQIVLLMVSGLVFAASMLILIGAMLQGEEEVKQAAGLVGMPFLLPMYVLPILLGNLSSPLNLVFALLPFTSPQVIGIQSLFTEIAWWKILAAMGIQIVCSVVFVRLSALAFQRGMLRYGQSVRLGELFGKSRKGSISHD